MKDVKKRRQYMIDRGFQLRFIVKFCLVILAAGLLVGILTYFFTQQTTTVAIENQRVVVKTTADFILPTVWIILTVSTVLGGLVTICVALFASHKLSGPLFRLKVEFKRMSQGDLTMPVHIRSKDQLHEIANEVDAMRCLLKDSLSTIKEQWTVVKEKMPEGTRAETSDEAEKIDQALARFKTNK